MVRSNLYVTVIETENEYIFEKLLQILIKHFFYSDFLSRTQNLNEY